MRASAVDSRLDDFIDVLGRIVAKRLLEEHPGVARKRAVSCRGARDAADVADCGLRETERAHAEGLP